MPKKIFIGGLSVQASLADVSKHFSQAGTVLGVQLETARDGARGSVEMSTDEEARTAISRLNGQELAGSRLAVSDGTTA
jgi:RNA recognition motif-containing protein